MRTCVNCGAAMRDAARFCPACGQQAEPPAVLSQPEAALSPRATILSHEPAAPATAVPLCAGCHQALKEGARFCGSCGARVEETAAEPPACISCGATLKPNARFCGECGSSAAGTEQAAAESQDAMVDAGALTVVMSPEATVLMSPEATVVTPPEGVQEPDGRAEEPADDDIGEQTTGELVAARQPDPGPSGGSDACESPASPVVEGSDEVMMPTSGTTAFEEEVLARLTAIEARLDEILRAAREAQ